LAQVERVQVEEGIVCLVLLPFIDLCVEPGHACDAVDHPLDALLSARGIRFAISDLQYIRLGENNLPEAEPPKVLIHAVGCQLSPRGLVRIRVMWIFYLDGIEITVLLRLAPLLGCLGDLIQHLIQPLDINCLVQYFQDALLEHTGVLELQDRELRFVSVEFVPAHIQVVLHFQLLFELGEGVEAINVVLFLGFGAVPRGLARPVVVIKPLDVARP
jgi:hypothetical protein